MDEKTAQNLDRRLARVGGQIEGVRRMVKERQYCVDILTQLAATKSALDQVASMLAASHVRTCIAGDPCESQHEHCKNMSREDLLEELETTLSRLMR